MKKVYIIGDVHGNYNTLLALLKKIPSNEKICFVGDIIDKGKNSCKVIKLIKENKNFDCVAGNHEQLMIKELPVFFTNNYILKDCEWKSNGAQYTLDSYYKFYDKNKAKAAKMIQEDLKWIKKMPIFIEYDIKDKKGRKLVVSHSVINDYYNKIKQKPNNKKVKYGIVWNREKPKEKNNLIFNIYGHSPVFGLKEKYGKKYDCFYKNIILNDKMGYANIDSGCSFKKELTAVEFPKMKIITQKYID